MGKKLYVGNLTYTMSEDQLRAMIEEFGAVVSAQIIMDRETDGPRVSGSSNLNPTMPPRPRSTPNGTMHDGRTITVNEARPRENRSGGGGYGGGGGRRY